MFAGQVLTIFRLNTQERSPLPHLLCQLTTTSTFTFLPCPKFTIFSLREWHWRTLKIEKKKTKQSIIPAC